MSFFQQEHRSSPQKEKSDLYKDLAAEAVQLVGMAKHRRGGSLFDAAHTGYTQGEAAKSFAQSCHNYLFGAWDRHMQRYLTARFLHLHLTKTEAHALALNIGRSWQSVHRRRQRNRPDPPLPPPREEAKLAKWHGEEVWQPAMSTQAWQELVDAYRRPRTPRDADYGQHPFPASDTEEELLIARYQWLQCITELNETPERKGHQLSSFNLLPRAHHGRVFAAYSKGGILDICRGAGMPDLPKSTKEFNPLRIFHAHLLQRILRRSPESAKWSALALSGTFLRSDGVQAHIVCGEASTEGRANRYSKRQEEDDEDEEEDNNEEDPEEAASAEEKGDIEDPAMLLSDSLGHLTACDPGRKRLLYIVRAVEVHQSDPHALVEPIQLADGRLVHVKLVKVLSLTQEHYAWLCQRGRRSRRREVLAKHNPEYTAAIRTISAASTKTTHVADAIQQHVHCFPEIHAVSGRRSMARMKFGSMISTQKALAWIARQVLPKSDPQRIVAWGGARWAVTAKGNAACSTFKIFRYIKAQPFSTVKITDSEGHVTEESRLRREKEHCSSCKCPSCMDMQKMYNPKMRNYVRRKWERDPQSGRFHRVKVLQTEPDPKGCYDLYQCATEGCHRTWPRDGAGSGGIFRCFWERAHHRPRPRTYALPEPPKSTGTEAPAAASRSTEGRPRKGRGRGGKGSKAPAPRRG
jgi:hypothetical protein